MSTTAPPAKSEAGLAPVSAPTTEHSGRPLCCYTKLCVTAQRIIDKFGVPKDRGEFGPGHPAHRVFDKVCVELPFYAPVSGAQLFWVCAKRAGIDPKDGTRLHQLAAYIAGSQE